MQQNYPLGMGSNPLPTEFLLPQLLRFSISSRLAFRLRLRLRRQDRPMAHSPSNRLFRRRRKRGTPLLPYHHQPQPFNQQPQQQPPFIQRQPAPQPATVHHRTQSWDTTTPAATLHQRHHTFDCLSMASALSQGTSTDVPSLLKQVEDAKNALAAEKLAHQKTTRELELVQRRIRDDVPTDIDFSVMQLDTVAQSEDYVKFGYWLIEARNAWDSLKSSPFDPPLYLLLVWIGVPSRNAMLRLSDDEVSLIFDKLVQYNFFSRKECPENGSRRTKLKKLAKLLKWREPTSTELQT